MDYISYVPETGHKLRKKSHRKFFKNYFFHVQDFSGKSLSCDRILARNFCVFPESAAAVVRAALVPAVQMCGEELREVAYHLGRP